VRPFSCCSHNQLTRSAHLWPGAWPTRITTIMRTVSLTTPPQGVRVARWRRAPWPCSRSGSCSVPWRSARWASRSRRSTRLPSGRSSCARPTSATARATVPTAATAPSDGSAGRSAGSAAGPARRRRPCRPRRARSHPRSPLRRPRRRARARLRRAHPRLGRSLSPLPRHPRSLSPLPRHPRRLRRPTTTTGAMPIPMRTTGPAMTTPASPANSTTA